MIIVRKLEHTNRERTEVSELLLVLYVTYLMNNQPCRGNSPSLVIDKTDKQTKIRTT